MKKVFIKVLVAAFALFAVLPSAVFANEVQFEINSKQELKDELKRLHKEGNKEDAAKLKEKTNPQVYNEYLKDLEKEIDAAVKENQKEIKWSPADKAKLQETVIELSDGGQVIITEDVEVLPEEGQTEDATQTAPVSSDSTSNGEVSASAIYWYWNGVSTSYTVTKNIVHYMYPDTKLVLKTYFRVNTSNIHVYDSTTAGTTAYWPNTVSSSDSVTDAYASALGHDANAKGNYTYTINAFGANIYTTQKSITSYVKWYKTTSGGKEVSLTYSFS